MSFNQRQTLLIVLLVSALLLILNIVLVTQGLGDSLYADIQKWIGTDLS